MELFHPALIPFTAALIVLGLIATLELVGLLFGVAFSGLVDSALPEFEFDADAEFEMDAELGGDGGPLHVDGPDMPDMPTAGPLSQFLSWLCVGKVPVLILLAAFLLGFGLSGLIIQEVSQGLLGIYIWPILVAIPALIVALPTTRYLGLSIAKIMPKEETDAVSRNAFIGAVATIIRGEAEQGKPAEAKLRDVNGTTHYILVEPDQSGLKFAQGNEVLLVKKSGSIFQAVINTNPVLGSS
ncbi:MAG: YqiJ family protein [Henriciella sp.]|nr:YqiJ family protein [Henriciella sp.]